MTKVNVSKEETKLLYKHVVKGGQLSALRTKLIGLQEDNNRVRRSQDAIKIEEDRNKADAFFECCFILGAIATGPNIWNHKYDIWDGANAYEVFSIVSFASLVIGSLLPTMEPVIEPCLSANHQNEKKYQPGKFVVYPETEDNKVSENVEGYGVFQIVMA